jgi:prepilin-type N-terminal cleavage/methylation domain-containing protein
MRNPATQPFRRKAGFTILELLVVSILMTIVVLITSQFWRWFSPNVSFMISRGHILREAQVAKENLAADFGSAVGVSGVGENGLLICKDAGDYPNGIADWTAPDVMVNYSLVENSLQRNDLSTGSVFTIADCISNLTVEQISPTIMRITLEFAQGGADRELVLLWSSP